ncbi:MAG: Coq4 family protein [Bacteroidota bacterium]
MRSISKSNNPLLALTWNVRMKLIGRLIEWSVPVLGAFFRPQPWPLTQAEMYYLPEGSLGKTMAQALDENGLELIPKYESHDAKHVLLNYPMNGLGEIRLQFCQMGNSNRSLATIGIVLIGTFLLPECWELFRQDWKRGKQIQDLDDVDFGLCLRESVSDLRRRLRVQH